MNLQKLAALEAWFKGVNGTITAFSGGVDSSLVLFLSKKFLPDNSIACISASESLKRTDFTIAVDFCAQYEIPLEVIKTQELEDKNYNSNPSNRCFFCKSHLYQDLSVVQQKFPGYQVLNGTNRDDFGDYRPGIQAANNHEVRSPLADCGLNKQDVREMAKYFGLPNWDKPASPCLSSRIPYGQTVTNDKLRRIEAAEVILNKLGFSEVRVRHFEQTARIEVPANKIADLQKIYPSISESFKLLGFQSCTIDQEGLVSGKLNRALKQNGII